MFVILSYFFLSLLLRGRKIKHAHEEEKIHIFSFLIGEESVKKRRTAENFQEPNPCQKSSAYKYFNFLPQAVEVSEV